MENALITLFSFIAALVALSFFIDLTASAVIGCALGAMCMNIWHYYKDSK